MSDEFAERLRRLQDFLIRVAGGDYAARMPLDGVPDEIEATAAAANLLAQELDAAHQRQRAAEELLRDERDAYDQAPGMFCSLDAETLTILKCNQTLCRVLGWPRHELIGRSVLDLHHADSREAFRRVVARPASDSYGQDEEFVLVGRSGETFDVTLQISRASIGGVARYRLIWRDITRQKKLASNLLHAQKMQLVGQLAGGVAHDFNNLLTVIQNCAIFIAEDAVAVPEIQGHVRDLNAAAERAAELTQHLLTFSRRHRNEPRVVDLNALIRGFEGVLQRLLPSSITLSLDLHAEPLHVEVDPTHFEQVVMNLAVNGRDAMPSGGELHIRTRVVTRDTYPDLALHRTHAQLTIADTGTGMTEEVQAHAFEPFYTTKPVGIGSGLGLAICYGIVQQVGGHIKLESQPNKGTAVHVILPVSAERVTSHRHSRQIPARGDAELVLVVEDDPTVRAITQRTLERGGYRVVAFASGGDALEYLDCETVDLLLTDVVMSGVDGIELARRVRATLPGLPVLFMSGYTEDESFAHEHTRAAMLPKPFVPGQLLYAVGKLLGSEH